MTSVIFRKSNNSVFLSDTPMHSLKSPYEVKTTRRISILNKCFQLVLTVKQSHSNKAKTNKFLITQYEGQIIHGNPAITTAMTLTMTMAMSMTNKMPSSRGHQ